MATEIHYALCVKTAVTVYVRNFFGMWVGLGRKQKAEFPPSNIVDFDIKYYQNN